jgi:diadenosine tetraphosphatase ApaH/serine/threonine PP2A family protein phosphatase
LNFCPTFVGLFFAVHGFPRSDEEGLTPQTRAEDLREMALNPQVNVLVCGHTHIPMNRIINTTRVINAGSVGIPFDGDPRACYVVINLSASGSRSTGVEFRRVTYDIEKTVAQLYAGNIPAADTGAYNLRTGHSIGSKPIYTPEMSHPLNA